MPTARPDITVRGKYRWIERGRLRADPGAESGKVDVVPFALLAFFVGALGVLRRLLHLILRDLLVTDLEGRSIEVKGQIESAVRSRERRAENRRYGKGTGRLDEGPEIHTTETPFLFCRSRIDF